MQLPALHTKSGVFALVALDNPTKLAGGLRLELNNQADRQAVAAIYQELVTTLQTEASGLVLEPEFGLPLFPANTDLGLALRLEEVGLETDPLAPPSFAASWGVEHIAQNYGVVKLEMYYHPAEPQALLKKQTVAEIFDFCRYQKTQLLLSLKLFSPTGGALAVEAFQEAQLQAVEEFRGSCHMLALEPPKGSLAAATLTAELDIPWVVAGHAETYEVFKESVREAVENNARGWTAGEILWQEMYAFRRKEQSVDMERITHFITTTVRDRVIELTRIAEETARTHRA